jgi:hypothetical protein
VKTSRDKPSLSPQIAMRSTSCKTSWITAAIPRPAFRTREAKDTDEARAMAEPRREEGACEGWEDDVPEVRGEEIPDGSASPLECAVKEQPCQPRSTMIRWQCSASC